MKPQILLLLFGLTLSSCKTREFIVVVERAVPQNPSFVVFPANDYLYQVEFANTVERYLVSSRVSVLTRPATKEIQATKQATQIDAIQPASAQATMTERYMAFDDTNADYIVHTYADSRQVKIARRESKEIVTSFILQKTATQTELQLVFLVMQSFRLTPR